MLTNQSNSKPYIKSRIGDTRRVEIAEDAFKGARSREISKEGRMLPQRQTFKMVRFIYCIVIRKKVYLSPGIMNF